MISGKGPGGPATPGGPISVAIGMIGTVSADGARLPSGPRHRVVIGASGIRH
jgi:hypothetical protein